MTKSTKRLQREAGKRIAAELASRTEAEYQSEMSERIRTMGPVIKAEHMQRKREEVSPGRQWEPGIRECGRSSEMPTSDHFE